MRARDLNQRIELEERVEITDQVGDPIPYWRSWRTVWAAVEPVGGSEGVLEQQIHAVSTTRFRIRYISGVHHKMRIRHRNRYFNIEQIVEPSSDRAEMRLLCSDGINDG